MPSSPFTRDVDAADRARALDEKRRQAWRESHNYAALWDALNDAAGDAGAGDADMVSVPRWAVRGAAETTLEALDVARVGRKGPNTSWVDRYERDQRDLVVYEFVQRHLKKGLTQAAAIAIAVPFFRSSGGWAVTSKSIEKTLTRVANGLIDEPGRYYFGGLHRQGDRGVPMTDEDLKLLVAQMRADLEQRRAKKRARISAARRSFPRR
jgi:hypothetical protein